METTRERAEDRTAATPESAPGRARLQLSVTQLIASALAAVTATVAASYLGVSGTVIGAAVASVVTVAGNAVYSHSIRQTGNRVRTVVPAGVRRAAPVPGGPPSAPAVVPPRPDRPRQHATSLRVLAAACAGVFAAVLLLVTGIEVVAGQPLSDLLRGTSGHGTSVFGGSSTPRAQRNLTPAPKPTPTPTVTVTAKLVTTTPTVTVTAPPVTTTATPSATPSGATTSAAPSATPTPTSTSAPTP